MSLNINEVRSEKRTIPVEFGEETFDVTYLPNYITPEVEDEIAAQDAEGGSQRFRELFCSIVDDWDVKTSKEGQKVPLNSEGVKQVPYTVLSKVMRDVLGDTQGNR